MAAPLLQVDRLCAWYGRAQILYDVSLEVGEGEVVALMGRNGAGKSTTMKAIAGLLERRAGTVRLTAATSPASLVPHRATRARLGAGGPTHLHRPHRAREPRGRPPAAARGCADLDRRDAVRLFPTSPRCRIAPAGG